jgi:hypothetical protein
MHELQGGIPVDANTGSTALLTRPAGLYVYTEGTYYFKWTRGGSWTAQNLVAGPCPLRPVACAADGAGAGAIAAGKVYLIYNGSIPADA